MVSSTLPTVRRTTLPSICVYSPRCVSRVRSSVAVPIESCMCKMSSHVSKPPAGTSLRSHATHVYGACPPSTTNRAFWTLASDTDSCACNAHGMPIVLQEFSCCNLLMSSQRRRYTRLPFPAVIYQNVNGSSTHKHARMLHQVKAWWYLGAVLQSVSPWSSTS